MALTETRMLLVGDGNREIYVKVNPHQKISVITNHYAQRFGERRCNLIFICNNKVLNDNMFVKDIPILEERIYVTFVY